VRFIVRILASAAALAVAAALIDGITVGPGTTGERVLTVLGVAVIFGLINAIIRPIVKLLTLPLLVLLDLPFKVEGFWSALLGALVISVVTFLINLVLPDEYER
jgi:putative membrane protein